MLELLDRLLLEVLHPRAERLLAFDRSFRIGTQHLNDSVDTLVRQYAFRSLSHLALDPVELFPAPAVQLTKVQLGAVEFTGGQRIALLAYGVLHNGIW